MMAKILSHLVLPFINQIGYCYAYMLIQLHQLSQSFTFSLKSEYRVMQLLKSKNPIFLQLAFSPYGGTAYEGNFANGLVFSVV